MRIIFLALLMVISIGALAQIQKKLQGTWKVISISDDEKFYDMKKDSVSLKGAERDTLATKNASALLSLIGETIIVFGKNGSYTQKYNGKNDGVGNYSVDVKKALITAKGTRNEVSFTDTMRYQFKGNTLILVLIKENRTVFQLALEKQK